MSQMIKIWMKNYFSSGNHYYIVDHNVQIIYEWQITLDLQLVLSKTNKSGDTIYNFVCVLLLCFCFCLVHQRHVWPPIQRYLNLTIQLIKFTYWITMFPTMKSTMNICSLLLSLGACPWGRLCFGPVCLSWYTVFIVESMQYYTRSFWFL